MKNYTVVKRVSTEIITVRRNHAKPTVEAQVVWSKETVRTWKQAKEKECQMRETTIRTMKKK